LARLSGQGIECGPCALSPSSQPRLADCQTMQPKLVIALLLVATQLLAIVALLALYYGWLAWFIPKTEPVSWRKVADLIAVAG